VNTQTASCTKCKTALPADLHNTPDLVPCPSCGVPLQVFAFPALARPPAEVKRGEALVLDSESSCFYHPSKRAVVACESCGRFLCSLCDVELNSRHLCPNCLETGKKKGKIKDLENSRMLYDDIALGLTLVPMLIFYFTCITAPIALYIAIRYWNAPSSIIPRSKYRFVVAIVLATLQITGWVFVIGWIITRVTR